MTQEYQIYFGDPGTFDDVARDVLQTFPADLDGYLLTLYYNEDDQRMEVGQLTSWKQVEPEFTGWIHLPHTLISKGISIIENDVVIPVIPLNQLYFGGVMEMWFPNEALCAGEEN